MAYKGRVFSGARPTGRQHLGNYLGAIQNYVALQEDYQCIYCVVDIHALTTLTDTIELRPNTRDMVLDWLAAGMDPERSIIFVQSHVPQVTELHTYLSMITPLSWLTRVATFKEKVRQHPENVNYGLVGYPVLMTADIILYKADTVPVGEDQLPHLELAREIVRRFNLQFGNVFPEPLPKLTQISRVMGLDGVNKMSKSLDNHIEMAASPEEVTRRVTSMFTDPLKVRRNDAGRPEVCNVFTFHGMYTDPAEVAQIQKDCQAGVQGCVACKRRLAERLNAYLDPFREKRAHFAAQVGLVDDILADGDRRACAIATETIAEVREAMKLP